jgi:hypothetical protein
VSPRRRKPKQLRRQGTPAATNLPVHIVRDITSGPDAEESPTSVEEWLGSQSTNAPRIGELEPGSEGYAGSKEALLHRYLIGKIRVRPRAILQLLPVAWFGAVVWAFQQDNGAHKLDSWGGLGWLLVKSGLIAGFVIVAGLVVILIARSTKSGGSE